LDTTIVITVNISTLTYSGDDGDRVEKGSCKVPPRRTTLVTASIKALVVGRQEDFTGEVVQEVVSYGCPVLPVQNVESGRHPP